MPFHLFSHKKAAAEEDSRTANSSVGDAHNSDLEQHGNRFDNFHIEINCAPNHVFTDHETISGNCVLLSNHDEDVSSVHIVFQGLVTTLITHTNLDPNSNGPRNTHYSGEQVLFTDEKTLYEGQTRIPKNTRASWPFEFQLPQLQVPSANLSARGQVHGHNIHLHEASGTARIQYTLKAARTKKNSHQESERAMRLLNAQNHMKNLPIKFQPNVLAEKMLAKVGFVSTVNVEAVPRRDGQPDMSLEECFSRHTFESRLSSLLHHNEAYNPANGFEVGVQVPRSLIRGYVLPVVLSVTSDAANMPPAYLRSISVQLVTLVTIRSDAIHGTKVKAPSHETSLLEMYEQDLRLPLGTSVDLGAMVGCYCNVQALANFHSDLVALAYKISVKTVVECGERKYKGEAEVKNVQVYS